jgi:DNA repair protein RadA
MAREVGVLTRIRFQSALDASRALGKLASGSSTIDDLLQGGYEVGKVTEIFGASNSGKTQLAIQAAVMAAARGWGSVFVDTESTFRPERVEQMADERGLQPQQVLDLIYCVRARNVNGQVGVLARMRDDPRVSPARLVVVDTVTKNFTLEFPGREKTSRRQGALGAYLNRMARDAFVNGRVVLLTNRVASVPREGHSQEVDIGGLTLRRFVSRSIRLVRRGQGVYANVEPGGRPNPTRATISSRGFD